MTDNTVTLNTASLGGGLHFNHSGGNTITSNTITANTSTGSSGGGGIGLGYSGYTTLENNTIMGNTASTNGGGLWIQGSGSITLTANTLTDNSANAKGGAVYSTNSNNNTLLSNTITDNTANGEAGALYLDRGDYTTLLGNTIAHNHTFTGETGGVFVTYDTNWLSLVGDPGTGSYNLICCNDGYQLYNNNVFNADGHNDVDATYVNWCTEDTDEIQDGIWDYFDDATRAFVVWYPFAPFTPGDFDEDGDADLADFAEFTTCFTGPGGGMPPGCEPADLDCDNDTDLADFAAFQAVFTGPVP